MTKIETLPQPKKSSFNICVCFNAESLKPIRQTGGYHTKDDTNTRWALIWRRPAHSTRVTAVSDQRSFKRPAPSCCVDSKCTWAHLCASRHVGLKMTCGQARWWRIAVLMSRERLHCRPTKNWSKLLSLLSIGALRRLLRCAYTGGFKTCIISDLMIRESAFTYFKHSCLCSNVTLTHIMAHLAKLRAVVINWSEVK